MKKTLYLLLAALIVFCSGCDKPANPPAEATEDGGITYADPEYYPIVAQPITISASILTYPSLGDVGARTLWKTISDVTGITFDLRFISNEGETVQLMYASRDYPDMSFRVDVPPSLPFEAIEQGDIIELTDEMLNAFAPNWVELFEEYPDIHAIAKHPDGKLYTLPTCPMTEWDIQMRDVWLINNDWLEELGMNMPENLDQYTDYLRAVKKAAGTGSIPTNVIPLLSRQFTVNVGSWHTICDTFGLYNGLLQEYNIVRNGKVENNAQNPILKDVLKYMEMLYREELINKNFTGLSFGDYTTAIDYNNDSTDPWHVGSYFAYDKGEHDFISYLPMLTTNSDAAPTVRALGLSGRCSKYAFMIFAGNPYPVASLRVANWLGSVEGALLVDRGTYGVAYELGEDGVYIPIERDVIAEEDTGLSGIACGIQREWVQKQLSVKKLETPDNRIWAYYNIYQQFVPDDSLYVFPLDAFNYLTVDEVAEKDLIKTNLTAQIKSYVHNCITGKTDIDAGWDDFQKKLIDVGIERMLELEQKAYNAYMANLSK